MQNINKALLLIALSQLTACAAMSKKECLNANWQQVGYAVAMDGNINKSEAFNVRERTCAKHGASANWKQFNKGHIDGIDQYCLLDNAVQLGIDGTIRAIDQQVCPERDYPGFKEAFDTGYELHVLRNRVYRNHSTISNLESQRHHYEKEIRYINHTLDSDELTKHQRGQLRRQRRDARSSIYDIDRDIGFHRQRLYQHKEEADRYEVFINDEYLYGLSFETEQKRGVPKTNDTKPQETSDDWINN